MQFRVIIAYYAGIQATLAATSSAFAQVPQAPLIGAIPDAGTALQSAEAARHPGLPRTTPVLVLPRLVDQQFTLHDKETIFISHFELEGPNPVEEHKLREILSPYENRKLTLAQIYEAADKITRLLRDEGYLLAKAYVPAQDAEKGTLRLKLIPGTYGTVTVNNTSLVREDYLKEVIDHALAGSPLIHKDELERAMLLVADLPGAGVPAINTESGKKPETTDFVFNVPEARRIDGYLLGDNFGAGFFGRDRLTGNVNLNSPLGFGDRLSAFELLSQTRNSSTRVGYSFPLGYDGLNGEVFALRSTYRIGGVFKDIDPTGLAEEVGGTLTYALRRQREDSIFISANFTHRALDDKSLGVSYNTRTIDLGTAALRRDTFGELMGLPFTTSAIFSITAGYTNYPDPDQKAANLAGVNSLGNYEKINLNFNAMLALTDKLSFSVVLRSQKSLSGNLDRSEQMTLTGFNGVRTFDEGFAGDSGYVVTPELKYGLPDVLGYRHSIGAFTDTGAVWLENASYQNLQRSYTQMNDVGLSYYGNYEYAPARLFLVKAYLAHTFGTDAIAQYDKTVYDKHTKGLIQVGFTF